MATMRAQRLNTATGDVTVEDVPIPRPGLGEVVVEIAYCGICHSDLSLINGTFRVRAASITQGHEASGTISELGDGVTGWHVGDRVILPAGRADRTCSECVQGNLNDCRNMKIMAFDYDGAWAQFCVAEAASLTRVPDGLPMEQAAILADAVATPYGAVVNTGQVRVGEAVGVWGLGGLGTHLVQIARLVGAAPIIALDITPETRARALELGADVAIDAAAEDAVAQVKAATGGRRLDVAFDGVGIPSTFRQARNSLRPGGRLVVVGMSNTEITLGTTEGFSNSRLTVVGHLGYRNSDIATLASLVSRGRLDLSRSISAVVDLEDIAAGIAMLERREGNPVRILVRPNGAAS